MTRASATWLVILAAVPTSIARGGSSLPGARGAIVQADGRGAPWINLSDDRELPAARESGHPLAVTAADLDRDGKPEIIVGFEDEGRGGVAIWYGSGAPPLSVDLPVRPDRLEAADVNADGYRDLVAAELGERRLLVATGNGRGGIAQLRAMSLAGPATALAVADVNRPDGLPDVLVGVAAMSGGELHVYEGTGGAASAVPDVVAMGGVVASIATGRFDEDYFGDVAVAAGGSIVVVHGRDRRLTLDPAISALVEAPRIDRVPFIDSVVALAAADVAGDPRADLALLTSGGDVIALVRADAPAQRARFQSRLVARNVAGGSVTETRLVAASISTRPRADIVLVDPSARKLLLLRADVEQAAVEMAVAGEPVAACVARLDDDPWGDVVVVRRGSVTPAASMSRPRATFTVTTVADSGAGSLRQAILDANGTVGGDSILFSLPGAAPFIISPTSALPAITEAVILDGTSQPGYVGTPIVEIEGTGAGAAVDGLTLSATLSQVRGLVIRNFAGHGVHITGAGGNLIEETYIGLDVAGMADRGNGLSGIFVDDSPNNFVGGVAAGPLIDINVISGNDGNGVLIEGANATGTQVLNNRIGTTAAGTGAVGNSLDGVRVLSPSNVVGGDVSVTATDRNVISGNVQAGVRIDGSAATSVLVQGNFIGASFSGGALGNQDGVIVSGSPSNTIGGSTTGVRNVISANTSDGVEVTGAGATGNLVQGNFIGTGTAGSGDLGNNADGVRVVSAGSNTVGGAIGGFTGTPPGNVISGNNGNGIELSGVLATGNGVLGNIIGLNSGGTLPLGNNLDGILLSDAPANTIGGSATSARNIVAGNISDGIEIAGAMATGNQVRNNYIGTSGGDRRGNVNGVFVNGAGGNTIGGDSSSGNLISANLRGVVLSGAGATGNTVSGNVIGLNSSTLLVLGNSSDGVFIDSAPSNTIGGDTSSRRNIISGNGCTPSCTGTNSDGIEISGAGATGNAIKGNVIGLNAMGSADLLGNAGNGVLVNGNIGSLTIGGSTSLPGTAPGNVIGGNGCAAGLCSNSDGIELRLGATGIVIVGNLIGLSPVGSAIRANTGHGIHLNRSGPSNTIGGITADLRNVISGNGADGVFVNDAGGGNLVVGNYIGTGLYGTLDRGNTSDGVDIYSTDTCTIGGSTTSPGTPPGNVISGNTLRGINVGSGSGIIVRGNAIGTDAAGLGAIANSQGGIRNFGVATVIGGDTAAERNLISGNTTVGVELATGGTATLKNNFIGIDINGTAAQANTTDGVLVTGASNTIGPGNVISTNGDDGIQIGSGSVQGPPGNVLIGNLIGTDVTGAADLGNGGSGVHIARADSNTIGGTTAAERNVLSGNANGVFIESLGGTANANLIRGNYLGPDATGLAVVPGNPQSQGVLLSGAATTGTIIGEATAGAGNVISGNRRGINNNAAGSMTVRNNLIGTDATGSAPLPNTDVGILVSGSAGSSIGGLGALQRNVIAFNGTGGLQYGGVLVDLATSAGHTIRGNSIFGNTGLGIDLSVSLIPPDGVTLNDAGDPDTGANGLQNFPVVTSSTYNPGTGQTTIIGTLNSTGSTLFDVDLYTSASADLTGYGEGQTYFGSTVVLTDGSGNGAFNVTLSGDGSSFTSATATDPSGNTSEFSAILSNPKEASPTGDLFATKGGGTSVNVAYTAACGAANHTAFWGTSPIAASLSWTNAACLLGTSGSASFDPGTPAANEMFYFVLVGQNVTKEGSYGRNSLGAERPEASGVGGCERPLVLSGTCP